MKKKNRKKSRKLKKRKKHKLRKKIKRIKIIKKAKKSRKIKKKSRKSKKRKKLKIRKKVKRIKTTKKTKNFRINKQFAQLKKLNIQKVLNFILQPFVKAYEDFKERRKLKKLKKIDFERKEKKRLLIAELKLRKQIKEQELQDEKRIAKMISKDIKGFILKDQALLRAEQANRRRRFLESIRLSKKIEAYRRRELQQIKHLEMLSLKEEREDYSEVLERITNIKNKYKQIRENKIKERIKALGIQSTEADTLEDLFKKEKEYNEQRQKVEVVLESFFRSAQSLIFQLNKRWIPKHMSILRVIDKRWEENLFYIRYDDETEDNYKMLIFLEDQNLDKETIVVEDKTDEKYITKSFSTNSVFSYSDWMVDRWVHHLDRARQKKDS